MNLYDESEAVACGLFYALPYQSHAQLVSTLAIFGEYLFVALLFGNGVKAPGSVLGVVVELQRVIAHKRLTRPEKPLKQGGIILKHPIIACLFCDLLPGIPQN